MNNRPNNLTLRPIILIPLLLVAGLLFQSTSHATPYATGLTNTGAAIQFRLNESGIVTITYTNLGGTTNTLVLGSRSVGVNSTNVVVPGVFTVIVAKTNTAPGYISGVNLPITADGTNGVSTNTLRFNSPRGVAINQRASSPYFGRIYVANSSPGFVSPGTAPIGNTNRGDGIYMLNADYSDAVGQGTNARNAGISTFTNAVAADDPNTPWRIEIGEDDNLYIADNSTNSGTIYVTDPNVVAGTNAIAGLGVPGDPNALSPTNNHGRIPSSVIATGSTNAGNLSLYAIDTDVAGPDSAVNHIKRWDIGSGPFGQDITPVTIDDAHLLPITGVLNTDLARGANGKFFTLQYRLTDSEANIYVSDTNADLNASGYADTVFDSLAATVATGVTRDAAFASRALAVSPDNKYLAIIRDDNQIFVFDLTNGIPDVTTKRVMANGSTTTLGRDIAFDAAGNLYVLSSGQALLRVFSPGYITLATTTSSGSFSVTNITPNEVKILGTITNAAEPSTDGQFTFYRSGDLTSPLTVSYVISGTATRGADYQTNVFGIGGGATNTVTFPAGISETNVAIKVIDDSIGEAVETVIFTLLSSTNYVSGNNQAATVMITDDGVDLPGVSVTAVGLGSYELIPYRPAKFRVTIGSTFGSDVNAQISLASSTAVSGVDFTNPATFTVTIPAGATSTNFTVVPIDNTNIAPDKLIIATLVVNASYTNTGVTVATNTLRSDDTAPLSTLYSENFDVDHTANWVVKFATNNDVATDFFFDYSTVGVPVAPHTTNGTTRGLRLKTHITSGTTARIGVSVAPSGLVLTGDYRLRYDAWFNFAGPIDGTGTGSTELFIAGVGASENKTNGPFAAVQTPLGMGPAVSFAYSADGGFGAGTGQRDFGAYTNTVVIEPDAINGVYAAGTNSTARDNSSPYYAEFGELAAPPAQLTALPGQTAKTGAGVMGMCWHDCIITKTSTNVTWTVDGLLIATVPTAAFNSLMGSNIFFAMDDPNTGSVATPGNAQFALVDNVVVEQLTAPASTNNQLASLVISPAGTLFPAFSAGTITYAATNAYLNNPVTVTAATADANATMQLSLNGGAFTPLTNSIASSAQTLNLTPPQNTIAVKVTAQDTSFVKTYTVNVLLQPSATVPTLGKSLSGSSLTLSWPSDHTGYTLQTQTNATSVGLNPATWFNVSGSTSTNSVTFTVDPSNPTVFYRLIYAYP